MNHTSINVKKLKNCINKSLRYKMKFFVDELLYRMKQLRKLLEFEKRGMLEQRYKNLLINR